MRWVFRRVLLAGALVSAFVLGLVVSPTRAQAPVRPAPGLHFVAVSPAITTPPVPRAADPVRPPTAASAAPSDGYYYPSRPTPSAPSGGYYYPSRAAASGPSGYYYPAPSPGNSGRNYYYSTPAAPARRAPTATPRSSPPTPSGFEDDYAYKS